MRSGVVNLRASYDQEIERLAQYLVDTEGKTRIACFYQDDAYGRAGLSGIEQALARRGLELCGTGTYERNTRAVGPGVAAIAASKPEAVVLIGAYKPCAAFIKAAKVNRALQHATFCNISFVGTRALLDELGRASEGCVTSQVVPYPWDTRVPLIAEYHDAMESAGHADDIGFITLEGYMAAKFFCQAAGSVDGDLTRASFLRAVRQVATFDLGGVVLRFGPGDNQGLDDVFLTVFRGGEIHPLQTD
jgi:branched-chain amino acid transport system substrate-binding protein